MKVTLRNVRLAFGKNIWNAQKPQQGEGSAAFNCAFLLEKNHPQVAEINKAIDTVGKEKWGPKADAILKSMRATDKVALHDGDTKSNYEGFSDHYFISARSETRPSIKDRDGTALVQGDGKPYSGCYVYGYIELWAQDNKFGKRINASLRGVQFMKDGDAFSGGSQPAADEEFETISVEEDDPTA